jgi:ACS family pantothenate transporter-like MFS transporter
MNLGSNAVNAWWSILFYGANFAPKFTRGMWAMIGTSIALAIWATALIFMGKRERAKGERRVVVDDGEAIRSSSHDMEDEKKT